MFIIVNSKKNFVQPHTQVHTQEIERQWVDAEAWVFPNPEIDATRPITPKSSPANSVITITPPLRLFHPEVTASLYTT